MKTPILVNRFSCIRARRSAISEFDGRGASQHVVDRTHTFNALGDVGGKPRDHLPLIGQLVECARISSENVRPFDAAGDTKINQGGEHASLVAENGINSVGGNARTLCDGIDGHCGIPPLGKERARGLEDAQARLRCLLGTETGPVRAAALDRCH